jgi:hypothetical protein
MNANKQRLSRAGTWAAAGCVLGAAALFGGAPTSAPAPADLPAPASEAGSLAVLRQNAPAVAHAIAADSTLRSVVGAGKWPLALHRLAEFSKSPNPDYQAALRIIGDTVTRVTNPVGDINVDGDPAEWSGSIPPPDFVRPEKGTARDAWERGAAAVVRHDRLYLMAGLADAAQYFARPDSELRLTLDCQGDLAWDVCLSLSWRNGAWMTRQIAVGSDGREDKSLPTAEGTVKTVAEAAIVIGGFVPVAKAKPIWTLYLEAKNQDPEAKPRYPRTKNLPVFNENAREGVAAWPYVRTFLCLCADQPLEDFELTAAAIAIMSSTLYLDGDEKVRAKLRADNAEFLELARSIDAWQAEIGAEYRLKNYPLEAQLAWAARIRHEGQPAQYLENSRTPGKKNNLENYYWVSTSVETLKKLRAVALQEGLTSASLAECSARIDKWGYAKEATTFDPGNYRNMAERAADPAKAEQLREKEARAQELKAEADAVGSYRGKPVSAFRLKHSESMLKQIETNGRFIGSCGAHTHLCRDLMRALGIAPLEFRVLPSREQLVDHAWPGRYDPSRKVWLAHQAGRKAKDWWFFFINRAPVFSYAAEAGEFPMGRGYIGPRPFPAVFCRELQGFDVKKTSQTGIPTQEVREWMLTPCF